MFSSHQGNCHSLAEAGLCAHGVCPAAEGSPVFPFHSCPAATGGMSPLSWHCFL